ncbi:MAG TPA: peptidoglycan DD-metalloendopeptidase family protein [Oscillospiraceae bacterium]|nr:peptidoglycan DD-metalloendopeptidase family protein [Oscillospiraceae bacterium]HRW56504.1 peptidoglycan DD-metalloendopeptidase family protein [Oscillospiraceae bacterium]
MDEKLPAAKPGEPDQADALIADPLDGLPDAFRESTLSVIYAAVYNFCYLVGVSFVRQTRSFYFDFLGFFRRLSADLISYFKRLSYRILRPFDEWLVSQREEIRFLRRTIGKCLSVLHEAKYHTTEEILSAVWSLTAAFLRLVRKFLSRFFNYAGPVIACALLYFTYDYFSGLQYGLRLQYNGKDIAYISDENVFFSAEQTMRNRTLSSDYKIEDIVPEYTVVVADSDMFTSSEDLANLLFKASTANVIEAYGLYVDGTFVGCTDEPDHLLLLLDEYREQYREPGDSDSILRFVQPIRLTEGIYPVSSLMAMSSFRDLFYSQTEGEQYYTVEDGDAPLSISAEFGLSYAEYAAMNPDLQDVVHVGDRVLVSRSVQFLSVTTTRKETYTEAVSFDTEYTYNDNYYTTYSKVTRDGVDGEQEVTAFITYENGVAINTQVLSTTMLTEPVSRQITVGTKNVITSVQSPTSSGSTKYGFIWPTIGGYVSCGYWGYWGHTGMDIAGCGWGSNIYAAASGTVVTAGWSRGGYGYYIIINHGGGIQTLYGHCSSLYVKAGQYVNQGDIIAAMGATGNATGTHLHFEVRVNGQYTNPAKYF